MLTENFNNFSFNETFEEGTVQSRSKTIKKSPKKTQRSPVFHEEETFSHSPDESSLGSNRTYDTFSSQEKVDILEEIRLESTQHIPRNNQGNWKDEVVDFKPKVYKGILTKVIPKFRPNFDYSDTKQMTQMWRKVKTMLKNHQKPERRGDPNLLDNELEEFKSRLIPIIMGLPTRSFLLLRERVLVVINDIRVRNGREPTHNGFGKHRWSNYVNDPENRDVLELWNSLKRSRVSKNNNQPSTFIESTEDSDDEFGLVQTRDESEEYELYTFEEMGMYHDLTHNREFSPCSKVFNMVGDEEKYYQNNNNGFGVFEQNEMSFL